MTIVDPQATLKIFTPPQVTYPSISNLTLILDCGSCASRGELFSLNSQGVITVVHRFRCSELSQVLRDYTSDVTRWVQEIKEEMVRDAPQSLIDHIKVSKLEEVYVGATGGLRDSISKGLVSPTRVQTLTSSLQRTLGPTSKFFILTGSSEASLELHAGRYIAGIQKVPIKRDTGLLSGGGMTCQVAYGYPSEYKSLRMELKVANDVSLKQGYVFGYDDFRKKCDAVIDETGLKATLEGMFVVIETIGGLLVSAGVGDRVLTAQECIEAIELHYTQIVEEMSQTSLEDRTAWNWKNVVQGHYCIESLALLSLLNPSATVFACRSFTYEGSSNRLSGGWALGAYHGMVGKVLEGRGAAVWEGEDGGIGEIVKDTDVVGTGVGKKSQ